MNCSPRFLYGVSGMVFPELHIRAAFRLDFYGSATGAFFDGVGGHVHFAGDKFRDVIRFQARGVDIEGLLGQQEGFVHRACGADIGKVELCK